MHMDSTAEEAPELAVEATVAEVRGFGTEIEG